MFEVVEHTADVGLRIEAPSCAALFAEAARALFTLLVPNMAAIRSVEKLEFALQPDTPENLLVDWLSELLFTYETRRIVLQDFAVTVNENGLQAVAHGEPLDSSRHETGYEIKAVTYHRLKVEPQEQGWVAEVFLDL